MKVIISPAKKMRQDTDFLPARRPPSLLKQTEVLMNYLKTLDIDELKALLHCGNQIAELNHERYQRMNLHRDPTPALFAYDGIQYQYMAPKVFDYDSMDYLEEHLRILSGFYGVLRPFDGIVPYRLEMQAKLQTGFCRNLYDFWRDLIYNELTKDDDVIVNLASYEYSRVVEKYLIDGVRMVTCVFGELWRGKVREKSVYVKMARGEMVRFLAENQVKDVEGLKEFRGRGYAYKEELSDDNTFVFAKQLTVMNMKKGY